MPSFLKDISAFYGTGEKNETGQTLQEFLQDYDPYKYKTPSCTTDAVVFSYDKREKNGLSGLKVLLIKRKNHPSIGFWALPGGFVNLRENLEDTARRELEEETGVQGIIMEQIGAWGDYDRDPRARVITTAYMALIEAAKVKVQAGDDAADALWFDVCYEKKNQRKKDGWQVSEYELCLKNEENGIQIAPLVEKRERGDLIRESRYTVIWRDTLAADHGTILLEALLKLEERIRKFA